MPEDDHPKPRHPVTGDADRPPIPAVDRQRAYRRSKGAKSLDISAETHGLLRRLCEIEGTGIDATLRSALEATLRDHADQDVADRDVLEAAWVYLEASRSALAAFIETDVLAERDFRAVAEAVAAFHAAAQSMGDMSPRAQRRAEWLLQQGRARVDKVESSSVPAEPLAADARHGTTGETAQTLLAGGAGIGLNNASLVLLQVVDHEAVGAAVRVRTPGT